MTGRKGMIFVVSAPSGAGKTSLCRDAAQSVVNLHYMVSYTTRSPRSGEVHGKDYFFIDEPTFRTRIDKGDFVEWAEVHGNLYGTSREQLIDCTERGIDVILDIDPQGAMTLKKKFSEAVYVYVLPPSFDVLRQRLLDRKTDSHEEVARRLHKAREEIWNYRQYYYLIVNEEFKQALKDLGAVITAERIKMRQVNFSWIEETFIKRLGKETI